MTSAASPGASVGVPLRIRHAETERAFFGTVATFGTPLDVTVSELMIDAFNPADEQTASALQRVRPAQR